MTADREADRDLVRRCLSGDREAFGGLVTRHQERVYRLARRFLGNHEDALETTQETFARAFASLRSYDAARPFPVWVLSICANRARDLLRRKVRRPEILGGEPPPVAGPGPGPAGLAAEHEEAERLRRAVERLDEDKRIAVVLKYYEGLSLAEVAQITGTEVATLKVRLFRARRDLERMMGERA